MGLVDFALHPHLDHEWFPENSLANLEKLAVTIPVPPYAIDDQAATKVIHGTVEVVFNVSNAGEITADTGVILLDRDVVNDGEIRVVNGGSMDGTVRLLDGTQHPFTASR